MATQPTYGAPLPEVPPPPSWPGDADGAEARQRWHIGGPREAEWVMRKLAHYQHRLAELIAQRVEWTAQLDDWWRDATTDVHDSIQWAEGALQAWALEQRAADPEQKVQHLPSGKVTTRLNPRRIEVTDHELAADSLAHAPTEVYEHLVQAHLRVDVARLNQHTMVNDRGQVLLLRADGEWHQVGGVRVVPEVVKATVRPT